MIPKANGHTGVGPGSLRQWVLDESDLYVLVTDGMKVGYVFLNAYLKQAVFRSLFIIGFRIKPAC